MERIGGSTCKQQAEEEIKAALIKGQELENEIRRKFELHKDMNEAKENFAYCSKFYFKIQDISEKFKVKMKNPIQFYQDTQLCKKKGPFTCHILMKSKQNN
jgi:hypothetical protein